MTRRSDMSQQLFSWLGMETFYESQEGTVGAYCLGWLGVLLIRKSESSVLKPKGKACLQHHCLDRGGDRFLMT